MNIHPKLPPEFITEQGESKTTFNEEEKKLVKMKITTKENVHGTIFDNISE